MDVIEAKGRLMGNEAIIKIDAKDGIYHLSLNRPKKRNALNDALIARLDAFFSAPPEDARCIVISGEGGHFSAGLDLSEQLAREPFDVMAHSRNWHRVMALIQNSPVPVVVAMCGAVMGGGLELSAACHVRVAEDTVRFQMPEGLRGIFVGGGGSVRISKLIGADRLIEMMLTGREYSGREGERIGLAHYVVPEGTAIAKALELAERVARNSKVINAMVIQAISQIGTMPPEAGLYAESMAAALSQSGPDAAEGLRAFLERRPPAFR
jgi:(methylthio)acryloyl-CoA hydratase